MKVIQGIDILPKPLKFLAKAFLDADPYAPVIVDMTLSELEDLANEEDIVFQLVFDPDYDKWYLVAVGDYERERASEILTPNPIMIKRSILAFCPVDEAWIRSKRRELEEDGKMIYQDQYQEFNSETNSWESKKIMIGYGD